MTMLPPKFPAAVSLKDSTTPLVADVVCAHTSNVHADAPVKNVRGDAAARYCPAASFTPVPSPNPGPLSPKINAVPDPVSPSGGPPLPDCSMADVDPAASVRGHHHCGSSWVVSCRIGDCNITRDNWSMRSIALITVTGRTPFSNAGGHDLMYPVNRYRRTAPPSR